MIHLKLKRKSENAKQTLGVMCVYKDGTFQFALATLELPWASNKTSISRIFAGDYIVNPISTAKHPNVFSLQGTEPRTGILIHVVNYVKDLEGCIGVGLVHEDMNADGYADTKYSSDAMALLRKVCRDETEILLTIK